MFRVWSSGENKQGDRENGFFSTSWKLLIPFLMKREKKVLSKEKTVPPF
jgi:hypothetical protein